MNGLYLNDCSVKGLKTPVFKLLVPNEWKKLVLDFLWFSQYVQNEATWPYCSYFINFIKMIYS